MVTEIPKDTPEKKIRNILRKRGIKKLPGKSIDAFFGKLPGIENGLTFQKKGTE